MGPGVLCYSYIYPFLKDIPVSAFHFNFMLDLDAQWCEVAPIHDIGKHMTHISYDHATVIVMNLMVHFNDLEWC